MAAMALLLYFNRKALATFMVGSGNKDSGEETGAVIELVCQLALYAALFQVFDGVLGVSGGVLRGCGRQRRVAQVNVVTLWGFGVCGGLASCFLLGQGVFGLWYGLATGVALGGTATGVMVAGLDWPREAVRAAEGAALSARHAKGAVKRAAKGAAKGAVRSPQPKKSPRWARSPLSSGGGRTDSFRGDLDLEIPEFNLEAAPEAL
jgi:hypothetical protein